MVFLGSGKSSTQTPMEMSGTCCPVGLLYQSLLLPRASTKVRWSCQGLMTGSGTGRMGKFSNRALATLRNHLEAAPTASSHPVSRGYTRHLTCAFGTVPLVLLQGFKLRMGNSCSSDLCDSRQLCLCLMIPVWYSDSSGILREQRENHIVLPQAQLPQAQLPQAQGGSVG